MKQTRERHSTGRQGPCPKHHSKANNEEKRDHKGACPSTKSTCRVLKASSATFPRHGKDTIHLEVITDSSESMALTRRWNNCCSSVSVASPLEKKAWDNFGGAYIDFLKLRLKVGWIKVRE